MFPSGFADPALSNAIIFAILFAKSKYRFTVKCLEYQSRTIVHINRQLGRWSSVRSIEATIGAILLLIGAEVVSFGYILMICANEDSGDLGCSHTLKCI